MLVSRPIVGSSRLFRRSLGLLYSALPRLSSALGCQMKSTSACAEADQVYGMELHHQHTQIEKGHEVLRARTTEGSQMFCPFCQLAPSSMRNGLQCGLQSRMLYKANFGSSSSSTSAREQIWSWRVTVHVTHECTHALTFPCMHGNILACVNLQESAHAAWLLGPGLLCEASSRRQPLGHSKHTFRPQTMIVSNLGCC